MKLINKEFPMQGNTHWMLALGFVATLIIFIGVLSYGIAQFSSVKSNSNSIVDRNNIRSELIFTMLSSARERVVDLYAMINSDDPFNRDDIYLHFNKQGAIFARARAALLDQDLSEGELAILEKQGALTGISVPLQNNLVDLIQADEIEQAKTLLNDEVVDAQNFVLDELVMLLNLQKKGSKAILASIDEDFKQSRNLILSWSLVAFLLGAIVAYTIIKKISKIERRLFDEIAKEKATLSSIHDVIFRLNNNGIIVFANDKANDLFEFGVINKHISEVVDFITNDVLSTDSRLSSDRFERRQITVNDCDYWVDIMLASIKDESGSESGKVLVLHDISDVVNAQKHLEEANANLEYRVLERTRNLETTNEQLKESLESLANAQEQLVHSEKMAALGGLVAGISHEINTPIGIGVTSATDIEEKIHELDRVFHSGKLTKSDFEGFMSHSKKGLDILIRNLRRASDLIRSFKQVAVDQSSDEQRTINLHSYCDEIILSLHPKLKVTKIKVKNVIPDNIDLYTNPGAVYQVVSNLVMNSIIHAYEGFDKNSNMEIVINAIDKGDVLEIQYSDNGSGMDVEILSKIFDPFFTTKRGQGGSGLGMSVVYNLIVSKLHGKVTALSEPGKGLAITMNIPREGKGKIL